MQSSRFATKVGAGSCDRISPSRSPSGPKSPVIAIFRAALSAYAESLEVSQREKLLVHAPNMEALLEAATSIDTSTHAPWSTPQLLTMDQVRQLTGLSKSTIYARQHRTGGHGFPKRVALEGTTSVRYSAPEVYAWIERQVQLRDESAV